MRVRIGLGHTGAQEVGVLRMTPSLARVSEGCGRSGFSGSCEVGGGGGGELRKSSSAAKVVVNI